MSKAHKIRWRESDTQELQRKIKNYNAKIAREIKKHPENAALMPEKISMREAREGIHTRKDLARTLEKLGDFTTRGSTQILTNSQGEKSTVFEVQQTKKNVRRVNAQRRAEQKRLESMPVRVDGETVSVSRMAQKQTLKPIQFNFDSAKKGEFRQFAKAVERQLTQGTPDAKARKLVDTLKRVWAANFSRESLDKLSAKLDAIPPEKVLEMYYSGADELEPDFTYEPQSEEEKVNRISDILDSYS